MMLVPTRLLAPVGCRNGVYVESELSHKST